MGEVILEGFLVSDEIIGCAAVRGEGVPISNGI